MYVFMSVCIYVQQCVYVQVKCMAGSFTNLESFLCPAALFSDTCEGKGRRETWQS